MSNGKPDILLVDDDKSFARRAKSVFVHVGGYRVKIAHSFDKAVAVIRQCPGRMAIFVAVPLTGASGKNGFDLLEWIHKNVRYRALSYAWTLNQDREDRIKALNAGAIHAYKKTGEDEELDWESLIDHINNDVVTRLTNEASEATRDSRTGLLRIAPFDTKVEEEFKSARDKVYTLVTLDMDDFKKVNDQHGHGTGHQALEEVGRIIREAVRIDDHSCRSGGDEFLILLAGADRTVAKAICEKLQKAVSSAKVFDPEGVRVNLAVSCGLATLLTEEIGENIERALEVLKEFSDKDLGLVKRRKKVGR